MFSFFCFLLFNKTLSKYVDFKTKADELKVFNQQKNDPDIFITSYYDFM